MCVKMVSFEQIRQVSGVSAWDCLSSDVVREGWICRTMTSSRVVVLQRQVLPVEVVGSIIKKMVSNGR